MIQCTCGRSFIGDAHHTAIRCPACGTSIVVIAGDPEAVSSLRLPVVLWLMAALGAVLLPVWMRVEGTGCLEIRNQFVPIPLLSGVRAMFNPWLPAALALLLSVRAGAVNLSVWGCSALGAVVFLVLAAAGLPLAAALALAALAGGAVGALQASLCRTLHAPVWLVTAVVGVAVMNLARWPASQVAVLGPGSLDGFSDTLSRLILVILLYVGAVLGTGRARRAMERRGAAAPSSLGLLALGVGGALAAAGGSTMILASGRFAPGGWLWGDLRVVAAVLLCGGWMWRSRSTAALSCALLPVAMGVATMWMQTVGLWLPSLRGSWSLAWLIVLVAGTQWASRGRGHRVWRLVAGWAAAGGTVLAALGAYWPVSPVSIRLAILGTACWAMGMAAALVRRRLARAAVTAQRGVEVEVDANVRAS
ncbi:MAG: hypothetical protein GX591_15745 [Planctomycetes bacterium]|nr:hypothetical protein [Planctomycetota bacterium]